MAGIALGLSKDLPRRAADVTLGSAARSSWCRASRLPEGQLPYQRAAGAVVLPAGPGCYPGTRDVRQLVDFVAAKVPDAIGVGHDLLRRWTGRLGAAREGRE